MSLSYRCVDWNRQKRIYDCVLAGLLVVAATVFTGVTLLRNPNATAETLVIRGSAFLSVLMLHIILCIGPLCRLDRRLTPLLYNRRHLGVSMFILALIHAVFAVIQFHGFGNENPLVSVFTAYGRDFLSWTRDPRSFVHLPFEPFGAVALLILFLMAATSHDFWLRNLGASFWKTLHLGVYLAYGAILAHVALGYLQAQRDWLTTAVFCGGFTVVATLHLLAARRELRLDAAAETLAGQGFVDACAVDEIRDGRARIVLAGGQRVAVWANDGKFFATTNVCRHQGGPLGEGRIIDGCITCPWHGWNYQPEDGCSPPPFKEIIETHQTRVVGKRVWVRITANPLGTRCEGSTPSPGPERSARLPEIPAGISAS